MGSGQIGLHRTERDIPVAFSGQEPPRKLSWIASAQQGQQRGDTGSNQPICAWRQRSASNEG